MFLSYLLLHIFYCHLRSKKFYHYSFMIYNYIHFTHSVVCYSHELHCIVYCMEIFLKYFIFYIHRNYFFIVKCR